MKWHIAQRFLIHVAVLPGLALAQDTWVVDDDGPADFSDIQSAIDAANDGDTVLVRGGSYTAISIAAKGLTLQAEGAATLTAIGLFLPAPTVLSVDDLTADQTVVLRGFTFQSLASYDTRCVELRDNQGAILIEDSIVSPSGYCVEVSNCASVSFSRCEIVAPPTYVSIAGQFFLGLLPYNAIIALDSNLFLYDSLVRGSAGADTGGLFLGPEHPPGDAGNGLVIRGGSLFSSGSTFEGLDGGEILTAECYAGADGGAGIVVEGGSQGGATVRLLDCAFSSGVGGTGTCGSADGGTPPPIEVLDGQVVQLPGLARSVEIQSPVIESTQTALQLAGQPGDLAVVFFSLDLAPALYVQSYGFASHLAAPLGAIAPIPVNASGDLDLVFPLPPLAGGAESYRFFVQTAFYDGLRFYDGGPTSLLIVASTL